MRFKIGQRVKKVRNREQYAPYMVSVPNGTIGTVVGFDSDGDVRVLFDGKPHPFNPAGWGGLPAYCLVPLTPPGFSEFMERVLRDTGEPLTLDHETLEEIHGGQIK